MPSDINTTFLSNGVDVRIVLKKCSKCCSRQNKTLHTSKGNWISVSLF